MAGKSVVDVAKSLTKRADVRSGTRLRDLGLSAVSLYHAAGGVRLDRAIRALLAQAMTVGDVAHIVSGLAGPSRERQSSTTRKSFEPSRPPTKDIIAKAKAPKSAVGKSVKEAVPAATKARSARPALPDRPAKGLTEQQREQQARGREQERQQRQQQRRRPPIADIARPRIFPADGEAYIRPDLRGFRSSGITPGGPRIDPERLRQWTSAKADPPAVTRGPELAPPPDTERQINVWIDEGNKSFKHELKIGETYPLNLMVGAPVEGSLTGGADAVVLSSDVPAGGLNVHCVVVAQDAELSPGSAGTTVTTTTADGITTWTGRFDLLIPEAGDSAVQQLKIKPLRVGPRIDVVMTVVSLDREQHPVGVDVYRRFKILLAASDKPRAEAVAPTSITDDVIPTATAHLCLQTTHEWTTPNGVLNITVVGPKAAVIGYVGGNDISMLVPWDVSAALVTGPIAYVRNAAEQLRAAWENHLNDIDPADLAARLSRWASRSGGGPQNDWRFLDSYADAAHEANWKAMALSTDLRTLALQGRNLFQACFPKISELRDQIAALPEGARLNIMWTQSSGAAGFIPHIPWGLMYLRDIPPVGQPVDPMGFLGLRCRIAYNSHDVQMSSRSLGAPDATHRAHFLYWGDAANDLTGREARWQREQWGGWQNQIFVPQTAQNAKAELLQLLDKPQPAPTSLLYLFCQSANDANNAPALRFGSNNDVANMVAQTDFGTTVLGDHPLVFANACTTAAADPYLANALEVNFFERECRAYLGTETKVPIVFGSRFATIFFHFFYRMLDSKPMAAGEAVAQTRLFLWTHYRNIGGLFYCYVNQYDLFLADNDEVLALRGDSK